MAAGFARPVALLLVHLAQAVPPFVLGLLAIAIFALGLGLPGRGAAPEGRDPTGGPPAVHLVLPVGVLALTLLPWLVLNLRASVIEALGSDVVLGGARPRVARIQDPADPGPARCTASLHHGHWLAAWQSWSPGALLVEAVFSWPGRPRQLLPAAVAGDFPLLAAVTALTCAAVFAGSALADAIYVLA